MMKLKNKKIFSLLMGLFLLVVFGFLLAREGAILVLESERTVIRKGDTIKIKLMVDTKGNIINSARGVIVFDKGKLGVLDLKTEESIFKFWDNTTSFSNYDGKINFGGGLPSPGFSGKGLILEIIFEAKKEGEAKIDFKDGAVLLNDEKGTDILSKMQGINLKIEKEVLPVPSKPSAKEKKGVESPVITNYSENISSNEIFYAEGIAPANYRVIFYVEGKEIETIIREIDVDSRGSWFYTHDKFLPPGEYLIYAKVKNPKTGEISAPSEKKQLFVKRGGILLFGQFIRTELIFGLLILTLFLAVILLLFYFFYDQRRCAREKMRLMKEIKEANDSVVDGFGVLKAELSKELELLKNLHITQDNISEIEREKRQRLINDLVEDLDLIEKIQAYIRKEVKDIEKTLPPLK